MRVSRRGGLLCCIMSLCLVAPVRAQGAVSLDEFRARRESVMARLPRGILLLHARASLAGIVEPGFRQGANFYYLTGLENARAAILAVDGPAQQSWLFVPPVSPRALGPSSVVAGAEAASALHIEHVVGWEDFASYIDGRLRDVPDVALYTEDGGFAGAFLSRASDPPGLAPVENPFLLWRQAVATRWPNAGVRVDSAVLSELRRIKSDAEITVLRRVGRTSAAALLAGLRELKDSRSQRAVEGEVVAACLRSGADGTSFWPWAMAGINAVFPTPFGSFGDYRHLDRMMHSGELVRVDIGCEVDHYEGDVGRTAPVSGRFDPGQRETWELLVRAYRTGVAVIRDGLPAKDVAAASFREIARLRDSLRTPLARKAAEQLLGQGARFWQLHGVGVDPAEGPVADAAGTSTDTLRAGMVIDYEPIFSVDGQGFYLEDMILVTRDGCEILTPGLPYTAAEVERVVRAARNGR